MSVLNVTAKIIRSSVKFRQILNSSYGFNNAIYERYQTTESNVAASDKTALSKKMFSDINVTYHGQNRVNKRDVNRLLKRVLEDKELLAQDNNGMLLLNYYGRCMPNDSPENKLKICWQIWNTLLTNNIDLDVKHYNAFLQVLVDNREKISGVEFLADMKCTPNPETYDLLLRNSCQSGNITDAINIVQTMKDKSLPITETAFNLLVLGHSIHGGIRSGNTIIETMRNSSIPVSSTTYTYLLKGLGVYGDNKEFSNGLLIVNNANVEFSPEEVLDIVQFISTSGQYKLLPLFNDEISKVLPLPKYLIPEMENVCVHLVHLHYPEAAIKVLELLGDASIPDNYEYGTFILKEMIYNKTATDKIISITNHLRKSERNKMALENAARIALKTADIDMALAIFKEMKEAQLKLCPHYFWPLFIKLGKENGEEDLISLLQVMNELEVHADLDTLQYYVFTFCALVEPQSIILRLQELNYTVTELFTPLCVVLLKRNKMVELNHLCKLYKVKLNGEYLIKPLAEAWKYAKDASEICNFLRTICQEGDAKRDWTGDLLVKAMKMSRNHINHKKFHDLLMGIASSKLTVSLSSGEIVKQLVASNMTKNALHMSVLEAVDNIVDVSKTMDTDATVIPHPKNMSLDEMECHLVELKAKELETRGLIRKLFTAHCRAGNTKRAEELYNEFKECDYEHSTGMLSNLMDLYAKENILDKAIDSFNEINRTKQNFLLDDFKLINYAKLLVKNSKYDEAVDAIKTIDTKRSSRLGIEKNVWRLLNALADTGDADKVNEMFYLLVENKYCDTSNVILGPLVKVHLNNNDSDKALVEYQRCCAKYRHTPLQYELICHALNQGRKDLLQNVLNSTSKIHGEISTKVTLMGALCECQMKKPLRKLLSEIEINIDKYLEFRCRRFLQENKLDPLLLLAETAAGTFKFNIDIVHKYVLQVYNLRNDCDGAIQFLRNLEESEQIIQPELIHLLTHMLIANKREMPKDLQLKAKDLRLNTVN